MKCHFYNRGKSRNGCIIAIILFSFSRTTTFDFWQQQYLTTTTTTFDFAGDIEEDDPRIYEVSLSFIAVLCQAVQSSFRFSHFFSQSDYVGDLQHFVLHKLFQVLLKFETISQKYKNLFQTTLTINYLVSQELDQFSY